MGERICGVCGHEAQGFASVWTAKTGDVPYCHGDDETEATCYERAQRTVAADVGVPLSIALDWPPAADSQPAQDSTAAGEMDG